MKAVWAARQVLLSTPLRVHLCGAGYQGGQPVPGVDRGPEFVRQHDVTGSIERLGWLLSDSGDLSFPTFDFDPPAYVPGGGRVRTPRAVGAATHVLHDKVLAHASQGEFCLTIGGDHSLAIGTVSATAAAWGRENIRVLWIDAHADINTPVNLFI